MTVTRAPIESPASRMRQMNSSSSWIAARIRAKKRIVVGARRIHRLQHQRTHLRQVAVNADLQPFAQVFARDGAGRHAHHGLARRGTSAAAIVAKAVFLVVGIVRMAGAKAILDFLVVARALIFVRDQQADRRARGPALEYAGQDAHRIGLAALAGELRGARAAPLDIGLQVRLAQLQARRAAIHDAAERRAMALPEARHREKPTEGIARHRRFSCRYAAADLPPATRIPAAAHRNLRPNKRHPRKGPQQRVFGIADLHDQDAIAARCRRAAAKIARTESRPSTPEANPSLGSCAYSRGKVRISARPT